MAERPTHWMAELEKARRDLEAWERRFSIAALEVSEGAEEVPSTVRWNLAFQRRRVAALTRALRDAARLRQQPA